MRKRGSRRGSRLESVMNTIAVRRLFILEFSRWPPFEREPIGSFGEKRKAGRLGMSAPNFVGKVSWNCLRIFLSAETKRKFRRNSASKKEKKARHKGKEVK